MESLMSLEWAVELRVDWGSIHAWVAEGVSSRLKERARGRTEDLKVLFCFFLKRERYILVSFDMAKRSRGMCGTCEMMAT